MQAINSTKRKKFDEAIVQYDLAIAAQPNDLTYYNNKCAVLLEQEKYDESETILKDVLLRRYEINGANRDGASYEKAAKCLNRLARTHEKQGRLDDAIECYKKSLADNNDRHTRNALRDAERLKEKNEKEAYFDNDKAEEHKTKGNEHFKNKEWVEAKTEYDEAIKRNPNDPKLYSNRAAALQKLMAHPDSLKDLDEALKLDPKFVKAYSRKGTAYFSMKDYNKALQAYDKGLAIDPNDASCKEGRQATMMKIQATASGADQPDEQQINESMKDPEIQAILRDPQMSMILKQMQENPAAASELIQKDAKVRNAVEKLMGAGILRMG